MAKKKNIRLEVVLERDDGRCVLVLDGARLGPEERICAEADAVRAWEVVALWALGRDDLSAEDYRAAAEFCSSAPGARLFASRIIARAGAGRPRALSDDAREKRRAALALAREKRWSR